MGAFHYFREAWDSGRMLSIGLRDTKDSFSPVPGPREYSFHSPEGYSASQALVRVRNTGESPGFTLRGRSPLRRDPFSS
jgi:hypothetical protein